MEDKIYTEKEIKLYEELRENVSLKLRRVWSQASIVLKNISLSESLYLMRPPMIQVTIPRGTFEVSVSTALPQAPMIAEAFSYFKENLPRTLVIMITQELMTNEIFSDLTNETSFYLLAVRKVAQEIKLKGTLSLFEAATVLSIAFDKSLTEVEEELFILTRI